MGRNKTKNNQGLKDSEKKFSYLVSEIFLQTNDCLAPEGDQKDKWIKATGLWCRSLPPIQILYKHSFSSSTGGSTCFYNQSFFSPWIRSIVIVEDKKEALNDYHFLCYPYWIECTNQFLSVKK